MAYQESSGAAEMLRGGGPKGPLAAPSPEEAERNTFFLPEDFPGLDALKPGDKVHLNVIGPTEDGQMEVEPEAEETIWQDDMKKEVGPSKGEY